MIIKSKYKFAFKDKVITFIRVTPDDLKVTIKDILYSLANLSWLSKISSEPVRRSFEFNATRTVRELEKSFTNAADESEMKSRAGEYIVSVLSKNAIIQEENHNDIPLMELIGRKVKGNPGFDFYTEKNDALCILFCGEAKYENNRNAYTASLVQIEAFIAEKKHISDLHLLEKFTSEISLENLSKGVFGVSSAFSTKVISDDLILIERIKENAHFIRLVECVDSIIMVGVDL